MPIISDRIQKDIKAIAEFSETPGEGATRPTFSNAWKAARDYAIAQLEGAGCNIRIDAFGNAHARSSAIAWDSLAWMTGSHLDTFPRTGNYTGVIGLATAMEVFRAAREDLKVALPLELVIWAEHEGATFGEPMIGVRAFAGELEASKLADLKNAAGQSYVEAGAAMGVHLDPPPAPSDQLQKKSTIGYVDVRGEPGPGLWNEDCPIALAKNVTGNREYSCALTGVSGSAGSTPMSARRDALVGAAEIVLALEHATKDLHGGSLLTVTRITAQPNISGTICDRAELRVDLSTAAVEVLARSDAILQGVIEPIAQRRALELELKLVQSEMPLELNKLVCAKILRVGKPHCEGDVLRTMSAAGASSAVLMNRHVPAAMLMIAMRDGVHHHRDEFARAVDLTIAAKILFETVRDRRLE